MTVVIQVDMYNPVAVGLDQQPTLRSYLMENIQDEVNWCMVFAVQTRSKQAVS